MFGLITMLIQYVGLFMTGLHSGLLVAIGSLLTYQKLSENNPYTVCIKWCILKIFFKTDI